MPIGMFVRSRGPWWARLLRATASQRYTRLLLTQALRRHMHDLLGYGLGMELLALGEKPEAPGR